MVVYFDVALLARDSDFQSRIAGCYGTETISLDPETWAFQHQWMMASQPGFGEAYTYAINSGNPNPGRDPSVITDGQILSAVQMIMENESGSIPGAPIEDDETIMIMNEDDHA